MSKQVKAKSDEKSIKSKEDERKRATEKHKIYFLRFEQENDQNGKFQKRDEDRELKQEEKWRNRKKGRHLEKLQK